MPGRVMFDARDGFACEVAIQSLLLFLVLFFLSQDVFFVVRL